MDLINSVTSKVFSGIKNLDITILNTCTKREIRPILPCLVRMTHAATIDMSRNNSKIRVDILTIIYKMESVNSIIELLSVDFNVLECDVKRAIHLYQKGVSQSFLIKNPVCNCLALEFERSSYSRRIRLVLSELLFSSDELQMKSSDLFDNAVYIDEICDIICVALAELPTVLNILDIIDRLLGFKNGSVVICRIVANSPASFLEVCYHLISNGIQEEDNKNNKLRLNTLCELCGMNPSQILTVRNKCIEICRMPELAVLLSLKNGDKTVIQHDIIPFISGLLLGNDNNVRTWFALFIRNGQKKKSESVVYQLRSEILKQLKNIIMSSFDGHLPDSIIVQASAILRLYSALHGIAGLKFKEDEISLIIQLIITYPSPNAAGARFLSLGLCMLIACPSLINNVEHERRSIEWMLLLVKEEAYLQCKYGSNSSFGEMLLLIAIHFHNGQYKAVNDLVCATLGMKIPLKTNCMLKMKVIFTKEVFSEQVVAEHAVKVPVTKKLSADTSGFLPVHCIYQLLKSHTFSKHNINIKNWIYYQICSSVSPLHPILPLLVELYVNSILLPNAVTSDFTNKPLTENEIRRVFKTNVLQPYINIEVSNYCLEEIVYEELDISETNLTPQLLILYYLLFYQDVRLNSARSFAISGRAVVSYSNELMAELPIKYLLQQAQKNYQLYSGLFEPLLRLLKTHFPHLALVEDWLDDMCLICDDNSNVVIYKSDIIEAFENIEAAPYKTVSRLHQLLKKEPIDIWPFAELITSYAKGILGQNIPRYVQDLYKQVWLKMSTVLPRNLWELSIKSLSPSTPYNASALVDPLQVLRCDERVFRCPPILTIILRILRASLAASKINLIQHQQSHPQLNERLTETEQDEMRVSLVAVQESTTVQILIEACCQKDFDVGVSQIWVLQEVRSIICSYLHQLFISESSLVKLVHFQGYPRDLLEVTVRGIPSIHISLNFIAELLSQPNILQQVYAIDLLSYLSLQYPLPKSMSLSYLAVNTLTVLLGVLDTERRKKLFIPALPCLVRIGKAFPPLVENIVRLLLSLGRIAWSQGSMLSVDIRCDCEDPYLLYNLTQKTFKNLLCEAVLKKRVY